ncbi:SDR family NAD(P)-dependent oxidoreductase [Pseudenhygromyxa sp. WMMC2535]|uniref:SDR family NAD(P)-dependent oxidoreductase n=1 Tax=Pseudenhygromyxa sp. WMMC2535 TaxID=2712867 RepID=UPI00155263F9|nr:SDR family NAD(P)-dependent oxidoreductase [Pseudenhygromyxa sp. WMMC2535]NVB40699.1 SDR family NAD(P)-dependent oxidoreductase [Pseudenhygromyxa sp. WMMC2535]
MMMLRGRVALVTGASRGLGKGIATELAAAGATVIVTARTVDPRGDRPGSLRATIATIRNTGGLCEGFAVDHADDAQVRALLESIDRRYGRLDLLVNNVYANPALDPALGPEVLKRKFWRTPVGIWDTMQRVGLRSHYVASYYAAPIMIRRPGGLIVNISSWGAQRDLFTLPYGVTKAGVDRLAQGLAAELRDYDVSAVSLYPGIVETELAHFADEMRQSGLVETPALTGRAVVALARDEERMRFSGETLVVAELARAYGFRDLDERLPASLGQA